MQQSQQSLLSPLQATLSWLTLWGHTLVPRITSTEWKRTHMKTLLWKWIHSSQSFPDKNATDMPTLIWFLCMTTMSGLPQSVTESVCSAAQTACVVLWVECKEFDDLINMSKGEIITETFFSKSKLLKSVIHVVNNKMHIFCVNSLGSSCLLSS